MKTSKLLSKEELIEKILNEKQYLSEKYKVNEIGIFGSYARGEQKPHSDIDILIGFDVCPDLFTYVEIMDYLKFKLKRKVDLVAKDVLRIEIKNQILNEVLFI
jgi:uncharacterized protein